MDPILGRQRDRVHDHPALRPLHPIHFGGLLLDRQVLVDHANPAVLRHRDGEHRLRHRVHGGADQRHAEGDVAGEARGDVHLRRHDLRVPRHQQDVIEGQRSGNVGGEVDFLGGGFEVHVSY
jgi:hypothetical protein